MYPPLDWSRPTTMVLLLKLFYSWQMVTGIEPTTSGLVELDLVEDAIWEALSVQQDYETVNEQRASWMVRNRKAPWSLTLECCLQLRKLFSDIYPFMAMTKAPFFVLAMVSVHSFHHFLSFPDKVTDWISETLPPQEIMTKIGQRDI